MACVWAISNQHAWLIFKNHVHHDSCWSYETLNQDCFTSFTLTFRHTMNDQSSSYSLGIPRLLSLSSTNSASTAKLSGNNDAGMPSTMPRITTRQLPTYDVERYLNLGVSFQEPTMIKFLSGMRPYRVDMNLDHYKRGYALDYAMMDARDQLSATLGHRTALEAARTNNTALLGKDEFDTWWHHQGLMTVANQKIGQVSVYGAVYPVSVTSNPDWRCVIKRMNLGKIPFQVLKKLQQLINRSLDIKSLNDTEEFEKSCQRLADNYVTLMRESDMYLNAWSGDYWMTRFREESDRLLLEELHVPIHRRALWQERLLVAYHWLRTAFINLQNFMYEYALSPAMDQNVNDLIISNLLSQCVNFGLTDGFLKMYGASVDMVVEQNNLAAPSIQLSILFERADLTLADIIDRLTHNPQRHPNTAESYMQDKALTQIEQFVAGFEQLVISLCLVQYEIGFVHEDMHPGNIMLVKTEYDYYIYRISTNDQDPPETVVVPTFGQRWVIIDPGLSRASIRDLQASDRGVSEYLPNTMLVNTMAQTYASKQPTLKQAYDPTERSILSQTARSTQPTLYKHLSWSESILEKHADTKPLDRITWHKQQYTQEIVQRSCETDLYRFFWTAHQYFQVHQTGLVISRGWRDQLENLERTLIHRNDMPLDAIVLGLMRVIAHTLKGFQTKAESGRFLINRAYGIAELDPYYHLFDNILPLHAKHAVIVPPVARVKEFNVRLGPRTLCGTHRLRSDEQLFL